MTKVKAVIMVGGAADGSIGKTIAERLYEEDYQLYVMDRLHPSGRISEPIGDEEADNDPLAPLIFDTQLLIDDSIESSVEQIMHHIKGNDLQLHGMVYAAGVNHLGAVTELEPKHFDEMMAVNLRAVWLAAKYMVQTAEALKVHNRTFPVKTLVLGSNTAYIAKTRSFGYAASKAGVVHMLKCMHRELAKDGWEFTSLDFGIVESGMTNKTVRELRQQRGWSEDEAWDMLLKNVPTGKAVSPHEVAAVVSFLLSSEAQSFGGNSVRFDSGQQQG